LNNGLEAMIFPGIRKRNRGKELSAERVRKRFDAALKWQARNDEPGEVVPKGAAATGERKAVARHRLHRRQYRGCPEQ
jgi:hypothetical protein